MWCVSSAVAGQERRNVCSDSILIVASEEKCKGINDTVTPVLRFPDKAFYENFRNDPAFSYVTVHSKPGWWQRFEAWLLSHFQKKDVSIDFSGWTWLLRAAAMFLIIFILYKLIKHWYTFPFRKRGKNFEEDPEVNPGTTEPLAFLQQIQKVENAGNYGMAVRLHFLYLLRCLDAKDIIEWDIHKSNLTYLYEIRDQQLRSWFKELSYIFDCVCYGEFPVDRENYRFIASQFERVRKEVEK